MKTIRDSDISILKGKTCLILLYFTATWCGPCQRIKPMIEALSEGISEDVLEIYLVDLDENETLVSDLKVRSVPTFYLFRDTVLLDQCSGADITKVHALLKPHMIKAHSETDLDKSITE